MKFRYRIFASLLALLLLLGVLTGCDAFTATPTVTTTEVVLSGAENYTLEVGDHLQLAFSSATDPREVVWISSDNSVASVDENGYITAKNPGKTEIFAFLGTSSDSVEITVKEVVQTGDGTTTGGGTKPDPDPILPDYTDKDAFYRNYYPAVSYEDAVNRTALGLMSGELTVPDQRPTYASYRPQSDGKYIRNNDPWFADSNTFVVVDSYGNEAFRVYRGGAYITLEEVAAYVYAFGNVPANYVSDKETEPDESIWGEYLRLNNSYFSGDTDSFPYEPVLPDIHGCGGTLKYYEIDIGTTGTDCDPSYPIRIYNNGSKITRGAARIVYVRYSTTGSSLTPNDRYVFYTYNHYNDFQEYLGYEGGWGEMFGNITGGGTLSSRYDYNPTDYVPVVMGTLGSSALSIETEYTIFRPALLYCAELSKRAA